MKKLALVLSAGLISMNLCSAQSDSYKDKVKYMMELNGSENTFKAAVGGMIDQMKQLRADVPNDIWEELESEFMTTSLDELVHLLTPVYHHHLTEADVDHIIEFYQTPSVKKLAEKTPAITQESMAVGQQWGQQLGEELAGKLEEKGYK